MKITVISGSPKGEYSLTLQYMNYVEKNFPSHEFNVIHVGSEIKKLEENEELFFSTMEQIYTSDGVIWCFPVYFLLVPCQLKRFVELIFERKQTDVFKDKYATTFTTSVHYYDHTAHNYMRAISEDLNMNYVQGYSAHMYDLLKEEDRKNLLSFARLFFGYIEEKFPTETEFTSIYPSAFEYRPQDVEENPQKSKYNIVLLTDVNEDEDTNLSRMVDVLKKGLPKPINQININQIDIKGGCRSCYRCSYDGRCIYGDEFMATYLENILNADIMIMAASMVDRYLSSRWKMFFDRSFFNGHRPLMEGKKIGIIISGPLKQNPNLRQVLEGMFQCSGAELVGIVTDEFHNSKRITSLIYNLASRMIWALENGLDRPGTFLGVGGHMIFRDLVKSQKWFFKADYDFYKEKGLFDYPDPNMMEKFRETVMGIMMSNPKFRNDIYKKSSEEMLKPFRKVVED